MNKAKTDDELTFIRCEQKHSTCVSYRKDGTCRALRDTSFNYKCPFFKDRREHKRQLEILRSL